MNMSNQRPLKTIFASKHGGMEKIQISRGVSLILGIGFSLMLAGCAGPAVSSLSPDEIEPQGIPASQLPKGDVYADEAAFRPDMTIAPGDTIEISILAGEKNEPFTAVVPEDGVVKVPLLETTVSGLTVEQAESRIQKDLLAFYHNPRVQVQFKKKKVKLRRLIVVGEVNKPGVIPMARNMSILTAIAEAGNYKESALLEEIRIIRAHEERSEILTADVARLLTYGDWSKNLALEENDIVFVPRSRWGKSAEFARRVLPFVQLIAAPFVSISAFRVLTQ